MSAADAAHALQRGRRACVVGAALVLAICLLSSVVSGQSTIVPIVNINYNTPGYVLYKQADVGAPVATSRAAANAHCVQNGMSIFSGETKSKDDAFAADAARQMGGAGYSTFTGSSAEPVTEQYCKQLVPSMVATPNSYNCTFTFRYGLLTVYDYEPAMNQPGIAQAFALYPAAHIGSPPTGFDITWDTTHPNPRGYYFMASTGITATAGRHVNVDATVAAGDANIDASKFVVYCESQSFLGYVPIPTVLVQPSFVNGFKDLTWAQKYWWVIFLIVAVIILIVLFAILIYCCLTMTPPKEGPPIAPMVLRERNGRAYVHCSDDESSAKPRNAVRDSPEPTTATQPSSQRQPSSILMVPVPVPVVDPEDLIQATPSIFSQEETLQTTEGDSLASSDGEGDDGFAGVQTS
ncbi:hypothetical protein NESM_000499400 [Novymonas esmeraldas]|uniref:Membrane-associated protein n=1 Tax=Novymonas esmeraldas TaxID=1808958 RepID=A0AAW0ENR0_9TRYP